MPFVLVSSLQDDKSSQQQPLDSGLSMQMKQDQQQMIPEKKKWIHDPSSKCYEYSRMTYFNDSMNLFND